jgi:hypothetical protein
MSLVSDVCETRLAPSAEGGGDDGGRISSMDFDCVVESSGSVGGLAFATGQRIFVFAPFYTTSKTQTFCQDRLGTNTGKIVKEDDIVFSQRSSDRSVRKTASFLAIYI